MSKILSKGICPAFFLKKSRASVESQPTLQVPGSFREHERKCPSHHLPWPTPAPLF